MPKLFLSFAAILYALNNGRVSRADLDTGLFCLYCSRQHALHPGAEGEFLELVIEDHPELHQLLVTALLRAEEEGRVRWPSGEPNATFDLIDELLLANGYLKLLHAEEFYSANPTIGRSYSYRVVELRSTELEVIWTD